MNDYVFAVIKKCLPLFYAMCLVFPYKEKANIYIGPIMQCNHTLSTKLLNINNNNKATLSNQNTNNNTGTNSICAGQY